jgi:hypothetical protein
MGLDSYRKPSDLVAEKQMGDQSLEERWTIVARRAIGPLDHAVLHGTRDAVVEVLWGVDTYLFFTLQLLRHHV